MRLKSLSKKGQVNTLGPAILALTIAAIFLVLGLVMLQEIRDTDVVSEVFSDFVGTNETLTTVTESGENFAVIDYTAARCSGISAYNDTDGELIDAANYTTSSTGCTIYSNAALRFNNTDWNVTYTYKTGGEAYADTNASITGMGTFAEFWEIIVLAVILSLVMGMILLAFGRQRRR